MNLIKTDIVNPQYDSLWNDVGEIATGSTPKPVLVLVSQFENEASESVQLQKMLDACKLAPAQYNVAHLKYGQLTAWHQLRELLNPKIIFLIGIQPAQLGISALFHLNYPNNFDGRVWLPTLSVAELAKHDDMKKQLWISGMKPVFIDKPLPAAS